jgi:hypothetical protein
VEHTLLLLLLQVKYDQDGNIVVREMRDYLGALTDVERVDPHGRPLPGASDGEIAVMQVGSITNSIHLQRVVTSFSMLHCGRALAAAMGRSGQNFYAAVTPHAAALFQVSCGLCGCVADRSVAVCDVVLPAGRSERRPSLMRSAGWRRC